MRSLALFVLATAFQSAPAKLTADEARLGAEALAALLVHPDSEVRHAAAVALQQADVLIDAVHPALLRALADPETRDETKELLVELGPRAAGLLPELVKWGASSADARACAVELFAEWAPFISGAEPFLVESIAQGDDALRQLAARALLAVDPEDARAAEFLSEAVRNGALELSDALAEVMAHGGLDRELAAFAVRALALEEPERWSFARELLLHVDRRSAAAVPAFVDGLASESELVNVSCVGALWRIGPAASAARGPLLARLDLDDGEARASAALALARIEPRDPEIAGRLVALLAAGRIDSAPGIAALAELDPSVMKAALTKAWGERQAESRQELVALCATLFTATERRDTAWIESYDDLLATGGDDQLGALALDTLEMALADPSAEVRAAALDAWIAAAATDPQTLPRVVARLSTLLDDPDPVVRGKTAAARESGPAARRFKALAALAASKPDPAALGWTGTVADELTGATPLFAGPARFTFDQLAQLLLIAGEGGVLLRDAEIELLARHLTPPTEPREIDVARRAIENYFGPLSAASSTRLAALIGTAARPTQLALVHTFGANSMVGSAELRALVPLLDDDDELFGSVVEVMAAHPLAAVEPLRQGLASKEAPIRARSAHALGALHDDAFAALPDLLAATHDPDPEVRAAAGLAYVAVLTKGQLDAQIESLRRR